MLTPKEALIGNKGQSLVEILVALAVFSLTITAATLVFFGGQNFVAEAQISREAIQKGHDGMEALRFIRDNKWATLTDGKHGLTFLASQSWELTASPDVDDGFTRTVNISTDSFNIKQVELTVTWQDPTVGSRSVAFSQTLAPPDQGIAGDWTNPCVLGTADGDAGAKGTDVFYANDKAYVSSSTSSVGKKDLFIFDVSNPRSIVLRGSLNVEQGWKSLTYANNYVYGIEEESPDFFVIDVTDPANPVQRAKLTLAGGVGRYVMVRGNYVYATTANNTSGAEFFVIDVSNPLSPSVASSKEFGTDINEVSVLLNTAYLATANDTKEIIAVDVSTPTAPVELGSYDAPGTADGRSVHAKTAKRLYLGRTTSSDHELFVLDASTPSAITLRGSTNVSASVYSLITTGVLSFLGTDDTNEEFQNFNVKNSTNPIKNGGLNFSNIGSGADYSDNIVYMSVRNVDILQLVTATFNGQCGE